MVSASCPLHVGDLRVDFSEHCFFCFVDIHERRVQLIQRFPCDSVFVQLCDSFGDRSPGLCIDPLDWSQGKS